MNLSPKAQSMLKHVSFILIAGGCTAGLIALNHVQINNDAAMSIMGTLSIVLHYIEKYALTESVTVDPPQNP